MKKPIITFSAALAWSALTATAAPPSLDDSMLVRAVPPSSASAWGDPILGAGVKTNGEFTDGSLFLVHPLLDTIGAGGTMGGSLLFIEPYGSWGEGGELGGSLGLGFRHLFSDQPVGEARSATIAGLLTEGIFVGANVFIDYFHSRSSQDFWQLGVGVEAGTRYIQVRGNYYIPLGDDQVIERRKVVHRQEFATEFELPNSERTEASFLSGGAPTLVFDTVRFSDTLTTRSTIELYEEALEGWDTEIALLVPGLDKFCDVQVIGGYFGYEGDRSTVKVEGWRVGVEVRPVPAVVLHATWFEDDGLYEENWIAGVRLEIPLGGDLKRAFTPRRRHLAERLYEPVHRKNAVVTTSGVQPDLISSTTTSEVKFEVIKEGSTQIILGPPPDTTTTFFLPPSPKPPAP